MDSGKQKEDLNPTLKASVASLSLPMARLAISLSPDPYKKWHMPSRFETYKSHGILCITLPYLHALKDESVRVYFIPKIWNLIFNVVNMC
jgi:hypothetical protein